MQTLYPYRLKLKRTVAGQDHRQGVLLRVQDKELTAWGDAAPLQGFSQESIQDILQSKDSPSLQWAKSMAQCHLQAQEQKRSMAQVWNSDALPHVPIAQLIEGIDVVPQATQSDVLKLKLGRQTLDEEISWVHHICKMYQPKQLRLDANRAWTLEESIKFCGGIKGLPIEFVEEPCCHIQNIPELVKQTGIPIALDETIYLQESVDELWDSIVAIVLKPSLIGGMNRLEAWKKRADTHGKYIVMSAAFESGVGIHALWQLARAWQQEGVAAGLDTYSCLAEDVLVELLDLREGVCDNLDIRLDVLMGNIKS